MYISARRETLEEELDAAALESAKFDLNKWPSIAPEGLSPTGSHSISSTAFNHTDRGFCSIF